MREIKFRVWASNKMFLPGDHGFALTQFGDLISVDSNGRHALARIGFNDISVMQYTGLKDKNGVEIYEGDIVISFNNINKISDPRLTNREPTYDKKRIAYKAGAFILASNQYDFCGVLGFNGATMPETLEVIGNIYENPELLESV